MNSDDSYFCPKLEQFVQIRWTMKTLLNHRSTIYPSNTNNHWKWCIDTKCYLVSTFSYQTICLIILTYFSRSYIDSPKSREQICNVQAYSKFPPTSIVAVLPHFKRQNATCGAWTKTILLLIMIRKNLFCFLDP